MIRVSKYLCVVVLCMTVQAHAQIAVIRLQQLFSERGDSETESADDLKADPTILSANSTV